MFGSKSGFFIPTGVKSQFKINGFEFRLIVGIADINNIVGIGDISGNALIADRNANFLELRSGQKHGINFIVKFIDDVNGDGGGVE